MRLLRCPFALLRVSAHRNDGCVLCKPFILSLSKHRGDTKGEKYYETHMTVTVTKEDENS